MRGRHLLICIPFRPKNLSYPSEDNIANPYIVYNTEPTWGGGGDIKVSFFFGVLRVKPNIIFICENILFIGLLHCSFCDTLCDIAHLLRSSVSIVLVKIILIILFSFF